MMHIPDEARDAGISAMHTLPEVSWRYEGATTAIEAAAPHIARAAQVAVLREVVAELRRASWTSADPAEAEVAKGVALAIGRTIERKADALEAGASQAGEGNA